MMTRRLGLGWLRAWITLAAVMAMTGPAIPADTTAPGEAVPEGRALAAELRGQKPVQNLTNTGVLRMRDARNRRRELPVTVTTLVDDKGWQVVYQATDPSRGSLETLVVRRQGDERPQYEVASRAAGEAAAPPPRAVTESSVSFAGSDFWLCDLGLEFLSWPVQKVVKREISNGRMCWALDSVNPGTNGYASVRSWIDAEYHALLRAEAYDSQRRKVKEFSTGSFKQVTTADGREMWFLKDIRIRDELHDTRTDLVYQLPGD